MNRLKFNLFISKSHTAFSGGRRSMLKKAETAKVVVNLDLLG